jgi:hypothetical protein
MTKYASFPFKGVTATRVKETKRAAKKTKVSNARSRREAFQGVVGIAVVVLLIALTFLLF